MLNGGKSKVKKESVKRSPLALLTPICPV